MKLLVHEFTLKKIKFRPKKTCLLVESGPQIVRLSWGAGWGDGGHGLWNPRVQVQISFSHFLRCVDCWQITYHFKLLSAITKVMTITVLGIK